LRAKYRFLVVLNELWRKGSKQRFERRPRLSELNSGGIENDLQRLEDTFVGKW
jgi:hypothetical protein